MSENRIMIPLDRSALSERSLQYLPMFSRLGDPQFELVSVQEAGDREASGAALQSYLDAHVEKLRESLQASAIAKVLPGIPYLSILEEAEDSRVSMIIISTHGLGGATNWRMGSVADKVIRGSPCPVLVIGPFCQPPATEIRRMLVPLDRSELAEIAIPVAGLIARRNNAGLCFCTVYPSPSTAEATAAGTDESTDYLTAAKTRLLGEVSVESAVCVGSPSDTIQAEATRRGADLIVMSSHGSHGFMSYALGSVTERLLSGPIPVLIVRPGQMDRLSMW